MIEGLASGTERPQLSSRSRCVRCVCRAMIRPLLLVIGFTALGLSPGCEPGAHEADRVWEELPAVQLAQPFHAGWRTVDTIVLEQSESAPIVRFLGLDVAPDGRLLVTDVSENDLKLFDTEGHLLTVIGSLSRDEGGVFNPRRARFAPDGEIVVYNASIRTVGRFTADGVPVSTTPMPEETRGVTDFLPLSGGRILLVSVHSSEPELRVSCVDGDGQLLGLPQSVNIDIAHVFLGEPNLLGMWTWGSVSGSEGGWAVGHQLGPEVIVGSGCGDNLRYLRPSPSRYQQAGTNLTRSSFLQFAIDDDEAGMFDAVHQRHLMGSPTLMGGRLFLQFAHGFFFDAPRSDFLELSLSTGHGAQWIDGPTIQAVRGDTLFTLERSENRNLTLRKWVSVGR